MNDKEEIVAQDTDATVSTDAIEKTQLKENYIPGSPYSHVRRELSEDELRSPVVPTGIRTRVTSVKRDIPV